MKVKDLLNEMQTHYPNMRDPFVDNNGNKLNFKPRTKNKYGKNIGLYDDSQIAMKKEQEIFNSINDILKKTDNIFDIYRYVWAYKGMGIESRQSDLYSEDKVLEKNRNKMNDLYNTMYKELTEQLENISDNYEIYEDSPKIDDLNNRLWKAFLSEKDNLVYIIGVTTEGLKQYSNMMYKYWQATDGKIDGVYFGVLKSENANHGKLIFKKTSEFSSLGTISLELFEQYKNNPSKLSKLIDYKLDNTGIMFLFETLTKINTKFKTGKDFNTTINFKPVDFNPLLKKLRKYKFDIINLDDGANKPSVYNDMKQRKEEARQEAEKVKEKHLSMIGQKDTIILDKKLKVGIKILDTSGHIDLIDVYGKSITLFQPAMKYFKLLTDVEKMQKKVDINKIKSIIEKDMESFEIKY